MKIENINGNEYKLPGTLSNFQKKLYVHLIDWKWKYITKEVGIYKKRNPKTKEVITYEFDAILPKSVHDKYPLIYPDILPDLLLHKKKFYFKLHQHFNHMASSQAANVNLFLPILLDKNVNNILKLLKSDFQSLETEKLFKGFRIEFWEERLKDSKGLLGDHNTRSGTDSDIAIAYRNKNNESCLWLIEHKLTEKEFTQCGGFKSDNRDKEIHLCEKSFDNICSNKNLCYYHNIRESEYWNITYSNKSFFENHQEYENCPFKGGMNQLWRNQLLGLALEDSKAPYKHVYFSVVRHPENIALEKTLNEYKKLINNNPKFSCFTSEDFVKIVKNIDDANLDKWLTWYCELYDIQ